MRFFLTLLLVLSWPVHGAEPDLLEPQSAFQFAARIVRDDAIEVRYQIAPGYYMYRDKFHFSVAPAEIRLGEARLPRGKVKKDKFFGDVEVYRDEVRILLPLNTDARAAPALVLTAVSQGCADIGVCYVPQEQQAELRFVAFSPAADSPFVSARTAPGSASPFIDSPSARPR